MPRPRANVYVDGFNLYRRALVWTPYKWLDLEKMASLLLHDFEIQHIRYFTALIKPTPHNVSVQQKQKLYIRAVRTNSKISVHLSEFRTDVRSMPLHPWQYDDAARPITVRVRKTEVKGSDVALATHLIVDAMRDVAGAYFVVYNDSDLAEPIRFVVQDLQAITGLILPSQNPSRALLATRPQIIRKLRAGVLGEAQLPNLLWDSVGEIRKPEEW